MAWQKWKIRDDIKDFVFGLIDGENGDGKE